MAKQYLTPPMGFEPPKGTEPGGEFDASVRVKIDPDGRLCVINLNGTPLEDKEGPEEDAGENEGTEMPMKPGERMTLMGAAKKSGYV